MLKKIICHDRNDKKYKIDPTNLIFRPSVYGILINDNKILLSQEWGDGYDFPGGGINIDETITEALEREFVEETGLEIKKEKIITCESSFYYTSGYKQSWNCILMYFLVSRIGGRFGNTSPDEQEKLRGQTPKWINLEDIEKIKFYNSVNSVKLINNAIRLLEQ